MTLKLHHLRPAPGAKTDKTRVGRGEGSKGKTAGRGTKGTKARYQVPAGFEGGQMPIHMRLPKLKGFKNRFRVEYQVVNVAKLGELFPDGGTVGRDELVAAGAVRDGFPVKVLGNGDIAVKVDVTVDAFSDSAKVVMPLSQQSEAPVPTLSVEGGTNYGAAFRELARVIPADAAALKAQGYRVFRPCAFFLTDGEPLDHDYWETFKANLAYNGVTGVGMKMYPVFIPFGFRQAPEDVLRKLAYPPEKGRWYHIKSHDIGQVITLILDVIMKTVISSGQSSTGGKPALVQATVPDAPGVTQGDAEDFIL